MIVVFCAPAPLDATSVPTDFRSMTVPESSSCVHVRSAPRTAAVNDPIWETHSAPGGYNCRGGQRFLSRKDVERLGLLRADGPVERRLPANLGSYRPHPRFAVSPVARFYRGEGEIL